MIKLIYDSCDAEPPAAVPVAPPPAVPPILLTRQIDLPAGWAMLYPDDNSLRPGCFAVLDAELTVRAWVAPDDATSVCNMMRRFAADIAKAG